MTEIHTLLVSDCELIRLSGGNFIIGSSPEEVGEYIEIFSYVYQQFDPADVSSWFSKQVPKKNVFIRDFYLAKYPVTNDQYGKFELEIFGHHIRANLDKPSSPVEGVLYFEAKAYCQWLGEKEQKPLRLPTEVEWEYAASSGGRCRFPWGDEFSSIRANTAEACFGGTTPVGSHPLGASLHGIFDLAGNVEEWTDSMYLPYEGTEFIRDHISRDTGDFYPILRGGSYRHHGDLCLASRRHGFRSNYSVVGFRLAM